MPHRSQHPEPSTRSAAEHDSNNCRPNSPAECRVHARDTLLGSCASCWLSNGCRKVVRRLSNWPTPLAASRTCALVSLCISDSRPQSALHPKRLNEANSKGASHVSSPQTGSTQTACTAQLSIRMCKRQGSRRCKKTLREEARPLARLLEHNCAVRLEGSSFEGMHGCSSHCHSLANTPVCGTITCLQQTHMHATAPSHTCAQSTLRYRLRATAAQHGVINCAPVVDSAASCTHLLCSAGHCCRA